MSYLAPSNLSDAIAYLGATGAKVIAGCTDHFPSRAPGDVAAPVLDITGIDGFRGISARPEGWRIGAATTWTDVLRAPLPPAFDGLKQAAREVGSVQIQNRATLAGNLCNASPAADGVPPLLTLDARVEIVSAAGTRSVPLAAFITGVRQTILAPGELVSAILVPPHPDAATSAFRKLGSRTHLVISIAMAACLVEMTGDTLAQVRLSVGSCAPTAQRLPRLEAALAGMSRAAVAAADFTSFDAYAPLSPISDVRSSATYRTDAAAVLCQRVILQAMG